MILTISSGLADVVPAVFKGKLPEQLIDIRIGISFLEHPLGRLGQITFIEE